MSSRLIFRTGTALFSAVLLLFCTCQLVFAQSKQPDFPYQAMVMAENAKVFSGPDSVHYATEELGLDSPVLVYRHDPNGWCAIKPPSGSFSLVPEAAVELVSDNVGRILEEGVHAWVGTRLGPVDRPLCQIKLRLDEEVEILGEVSWPNPEGYSTIWYQIAPPAGEFRWIKISDLRLPRHLTDLPDVARKKKAPERKLPKEDIASRIPVDSRPDTEDNSSIQQSSFLETVTDPAMQDPQFEDSTPNPSLNPPSENEETVNRGWRQAKRPIRVADNRTEFNSVKPFKTPALDAPVIGSQLKSSGSATTSSQSVATGISSVDTPPVSDLVQVAPIAGPVSERIRKLELQLTEEMQKPPAQWNLEPVLKQTTSIAASTNDVRERDHAQRLQQKIRNCVSIQSRYGDAFANTTPKPVSTAEPSVAELQLDTTYDAHGWLNQLVRDNGRMSPTYVLEDDNGKITHHIAPSPGLNLQRYLKQKVGVIGRRGYHRNLGLNHVTAERMVILNKFR